MTENDMKEVDFTYCLKCRHWTNSETEDPCNECLSNPANLNSHKPVRFEEDPDKKNRG